ncbi:hypothetical protein PFISCL1PPCAC_963 [Pristionchus fissidentatus]|uniref:Uncharacterized protein n=1 Tax=Pristionchus fissidentatus TaxID=1538716 RepID=A0AAV5UT75_9BILA|nr:hypothetical protein PFISCL1PPCAC_963 [Pristionchus fissidentatus]
MTRLSLILLFSLSSTIVSAAPATSCATLKCHTGMICQMTQVCAGKPCPLVPKCILDERSWFPDEKRAGTTKCGNMICGTGEVCNIQQVYRLHARVHLVPPSPHANRPLRPFTSTHMKARCVTEPRVSLDRGVKFGR